MANGRQTVFLNPPLPALSRNKSRSSSGDPITINISIADSDTSFPTIN